MSAASLELPLYTRESGSDGLNVSRLLGMCRCRRRSIKYRLCHFFAGQIGVIGDGVAPLHITIEFAKATPLSFAVPPYSTDVRFSR